MSLEYSPLRDRLIELGVRRSQFAKNCGVSRACISQILAGKQSISERVQIGLVKLGMSTDQVKRLCAEHEEWRRLYRREVEEKMVAA
jgi:plasmid maintenance system antidote protein VapI